MTLGALYFELLVFVSVLLSRQHWNAYSTPIYNLGLKNTNLSWFPIDGLCGPTTSRLAAQMQHHITYPVLITLHILNRIPLLFSPVITPLPISVYVVIIKQEKACFIRISKHREVAS